MSLSVQTSDARWQTRLPLLSLRGASLSIRKKKKLKHGVDAQQSPSVLH